MATKQTTMNRINKELHSLPVYVDSIPLDSMFQAIKNHGLLAVDESGDEWTGFYVANLGSVT